MKYVSCNQCGHMVPSKLSSIVDHKRLCHECKKANKRELELWTASTIKH